MWGHGTRSPKLHQAAGSEGPRSTPRPTNTRGAAGGHRRAPCPPGGLRETPLPLPHPVQPLSSPPQTPVPTPPPCVPPTPAPLQVHPGHGLQQKGGGTRGCNPLLEGDKFFLFALSRFSRKWRWGEKGGDGLGWGGGLRRRSKSETYLSEFCAHQDEKEEGQELACRLHVSHPALGTLHADRLRSSRRASLC